jgi:hypothetical protein
MTMRLPRRPACIFVALLWGSSGVLHAGCIRVMDREGERRTAAGDRACGSVQVPSAEDALDPNPEAVRHSTAPLSLPVVGSGARTTPLLAPGSAVKHYEIDCELGQGGMGRISNA